MADPITLVVVDDDALFRQVVQAAFARHPSIQVVAEAANTADGLREARRWRPRIVLMDLAIPVVGGVEATRLLHTEMPDVEVVVVTASEDEAHLIAALSAGAKGYVLKTGNYEHLVRSVEAIADGQGFLSPEMTVKFLEHLQQVPSSGPVAPSDPRAELSERELQILRLVVEGASNRQIGDRLFLSENTVRTYLTEILAKLGLENRVQLAMYAIRHGMV
jgi:NarL family two-component system response regulator LiaR